MRRRAEEPDRPAGGETAVLGGCAALRPLFHGSLVRLVGLRCLVDGKELAAERCHAAPTLVVGFAGASIVRSGRRRTQTDPVLALWHRAGEPYGTDHPWGCRCRGCHIVVHPELAAELELELADRSPGPRPLAVGAAEQLRLRRLQRHLAAGRPLDALAVEEEIVDLLSTLLVDRRRRAPPRRAATAELHERCVARACNVLVERYREPLSLATIGRAACASPAHLTRIFRRSTGLSLHQYQLRLRLLGALDAVVDGDDGLSAVAHDLGFASHSHLTAAFRGSFGCTPGELRRERDSGGFLIARRLPAA